MRGNSRGSTLLAVAALGSSVAIVAMGTTAAHGTAPVVRYAAPAGQGTDCTKAAPCSLLTAVNSAPLGAEVRVTPGSYGSAQQPLTTTLDTGLNELTIQATSASSPPVIFEAGSSSGATTDGFDLGKDSLLEGVTLVYSGPSSALHANGSHGAIRDSVTSTAEGSVACQTIDLLLDSLCLATGAGSQAIDVSDPAAGASSSLTQLANDTAVADGTGGVGLNVFAGDDDTIYVDLTNTIVEGAKDALSMFPVAATSAVTVTSNNSDVGPTTTSTGLGAVTVTTLAHNIVAPPKFVDAAQHDFREKPTSPTVDAGLRRTDTVMNLGASPSRTDIDLLDNPRTIGDTTDIGAYELPEKPRVSTPTVVRLRTRAARMGCHVWAVDSRTTLQLVATHGKKVIKSEAVNVGHSNSPKVVDLTIVGMAPHMHYLVRAVARNAVGQVTSAPRRITTKG